MRMNLLRRKSSFRLLGEVLAVSLAVGLLSGCGGEYTGVSGENGVVSGGAVSGQAVNREKTEKSHRYCTDTNLYVDCEDCLLQTRLDGTHEKKIKLKDYLWLLGIWEGYLYYEVNTENGGVYRAPIGKDENGWDIVKTDQVENVIPVEEKEWIYRVCGMDSKYIFYLTFPDIDKENNRKFVQYNIESGEKTLLDVPLDNLYCTCAVTGSYLIVNAISNVFVKDMEDTKWLQIRGYDYPLEYVQFEAWNENVFFYTLGNCEEGIVSSVRKVDLTDMEDQEFISEKDLRQKVVEAEGIKMGEVDVCKVLDLFLEGDRLYVQVQLNWREEGTYHVGVLMFSQGVRETELQYEKELTGYMRTYGGIRKGSWEIDDGENRTVVEKNMIIHDSCCFGIVNGKAFLWFHDVEKKYGSVGCYELERGTFRWLAQNQGEYYELLWEKPSNVSRYWGEWWPGELACFPIFDDGDGDAGFGWGPNNANESGGFYEDSED